MTIMAMISVSSVAKSFLFCISACWRHAVVFSQPCGSTGAPCLLESFSTFSIDPYRLQDKVYTIKSQGFPINSWGFPKTNPQEFLLIPKDFQ